MTDKNKEALEALEQLMSVLCDPQGNASIRGSHGDLMIIDDSLRKIRAALTQNEVTDDEVREAVKYIRKFTNDPSYITTSFIKHLETLIGCATRKSEQEWQPIESAPKDKTWYLVSDGFDVWYVNYDVATHDWWSKRHGSVVINNGIEPTNWMPLPQPPKVKE